MDLPWETRRELTPKATAAAIFVLAAASVGWLLLKAPKGPFPGDMSDWQPLSTAAAELGSLVFLCASVLVFIKPRLGYGLGLAAGIIALPWFVWTESLLGPWNSWLFFNLGDTGETGSWVGSRSFVTLKIISAVMIAIAAGCSVVRLLPIRFSLRNIPLRRRTWPAFAVGFLTLAVWYSRSVTPYSVPMFVDGIPPEFQILHVEKRGLHFKETGVAATRDGRGWIWRNDRWLFQYRFRSRSSIVSLGQASPAGYYRAMAFAKSPGLWKLHTQPPTALLAWNADGWYVVLMHSRVLAFTSEYRTTPPQEVTDMFHEIERLPASSENSGVVPDISLGFGYDPLAALGFGYESREVRTRLLQSQ